jgi:NAD(P)-dependent dehydrogenase (short-subunit alcohol dehydrogenase family)
MATEREGGWRLWQRIVRISNHRRRLAAVAANSPTSELSGRSEQNHTRGLASRRNIDAPFLAQVSLETTMHDLTGKNAFITGGASGIGFAMAQAFLNEGMNVAIADVDADALAKAMTALSGSNARVLAVQLDVTNRSQYEEVAQQVEAELGNVHVLCNNAGVYRGGALDAVTYADWDWVMGVNVGGVINGLQTFLARMERHGEGGHVVNTASMAGLTTAPGLGVYNASKFAVVGLSEALRKDLEPKGIGVSVLCPGMVRTRILESERTRPAPFDVEDPTARRPPRSTTSSCSWR